MSHHTSTRKIHHKRHLYWEESSHLYQEVSPLPGGFVIIDTSTERSPHTFTGRIHRKWNLYREESSHLYGDVSPLLGGFIVIGTSLPGGFPLIEKIFHNWHLYREELSHLYVEDSSWTKPLLKGVVTPLLGGSPLPRVLVIIDISPLGVFPLTMRIRNRQFYREESSHFYQKDS